MPPQAASHAASGTTVGAPGGGDVHRQPLVAAVRHALAAQADAEQAAPMQAYMKSALPFHGVPTPLRRQLVG